MQAVSGVALMLAGATIASYLVLPPPPDDETTLTKTTPIAVAADQPASPVVQSTKQTAASTRAAGPARATPTAATQARASERAYAAARRSAYQGWTAVVTSDASTSTALKSSKASDAITRAELARDIQRSLKRAGCYGGEINGVWTQSTQRAMAVFMDRVNATLPMSEPDFILLTLVQSHPSATCSDKCPTGQEMSGAGRCVPHAILASKARPAAERVAAREVVAPPPKPASRPIALAADAKVPTVVIQAPARGPKRIAAPPPAAVTAPEQRTTEIAGTEPEILPWLVNDGGIQVARHTRAEPPGRMSVGAPVEMKFVPPALAALPGRIPTGAAASKPGTSRADGKRKSNDAQKASPNRYAASGYGKGRSGQPPPGTARYNLLQSLGGIY